MAGEVVEIADGYAGGGVAGALYRYLGGNARLDLGTEDYTDTARWARIGGDGGAVYQFLGGAATDDLSLENYSDSARWKLLGGVVGTVYRYLGIDATLDLGAVDYTDLGYWKPELLTGAVPQGLNTSASDSYGVGGLVVLNDVRTAAAATISQSTINAGAVSVTATQQAVLRATADATTVSSGGSSFEANGGDSIAVGGVIATNAVLSSARAVIDRSTITTTTAAGGSGHVIVDAQNLSQLDATTKRSAESAGTTVGIVLAFNSIGWKTQNILFNTVDAILGDGLIASAMSNQQPAKVEALISDSDIVAAGNVIVTALNEAIINAEASNDTTAFSVWSAAPRPVYGIVAQNLSTSRRCAISNSVVGTQQVPRRRTSSWPRRRLPRSSPT